MFITLTLRNDKTKQRFNVNHILYYKRVGSLPFTQVELVNYDFLWKVDETPEEIDNMIYETQDIANKNLAWRFER